MNKKGKWVFIVNPFNIDGEEEIMQIMDWEICQLDENHECSVEGQPIRNTCKKYVYLYFLYIHSSFYIASSKEWK